MSGYGYFYTPDSTKEFMQMKDDKATKEAEEIIEKETEAELEELGIDPGDEYTPIVRGEE